MNPLSITELRVGMSREEVVAILGVPDQRGGTSRKYRTPSIFKYGKVEFNFERWKSGGLIDAYQVDEYGCYVKKVFPPETNFSQIAHMDETERLKPPPDFAWPESWQPITDEGIASSLLVELLREVGRGHCLFQRTVKAVAQRHDCDDVLFQTNDPSRPLAVVHLTWRGSTEPDPAWPATTFLAGWEDWHQRSSEA